MKAKGSETISCLSPEIQKYQKIYPKTNPCCCAPAQLGLAHGSEVPGIRAPALTSRGKSENKRASCASLGCLAAVWASWMHHWKASMMPSFKPSWIHLWSSIIPLSSDVIRNTSLFKSTPRFKKDRNLIQEPGYFERPVERKVVGDPGV